MRMWTKAVGEKKVMQDLRGQSHSSSPHSPVSTRRERRKAHFGGMECAEESVPVPMCLLRKEETVSAGPR